MLSLRSILGVTLGSAALSLPLALGCGEAGPAPMHTITFVAHSDPGEPLAGVQISTTTNGSPAVLGTTDATGTWVHRMRAPYGTVLPLSATCPPGHRPAELAPTIRFDPIRSLDPAIAARGIEHSIQCRPTERDVVVVVRASGPPLVTGIPVLVDGRQVSQLDPGGVAHVALRYEPHTAHRIELAAGSISPLLRPAQPAHDVTIPDQDAFLSVEQSFALEAPPTKVRRPGPRPAAPGPARRPVPVRIDARR